MAKKTKKKKKNHEAHHSHIRIRTQARLAYYRKVGARSPALVVPVASRDAVRRHEHERKKNKVKFRESSDPTSRFSSIMLRAARPPSRCSTSRIAAVPRSVPKAAINLASRAARRYSSVTNQRFSPVKFNQAVKVCFFNDRFHVVRVK